MPAGLPQPPGTDTRADPGGTASLGAEPDLEDLLTSPFGTRNGEGPASQTLSAHPEGPQHRLAGISPRRGGCDQRTAAPGGRMVCVGG